MYAEIVKELMQQKMISMIVSVIVFAVSLVLIEIFVSRPHKKKCQKKKNRHLPLNEKPIAWIVAVTLCFCIWFGIDLYQYLSLREDMVNENYATYTGEFRFYRISSKSGGNKYIQWQKEPGKNEKIRYSHRIDRFQEKGEGLKEGYYTGTVVYSPTGDYLLWWDAERIGD